MSLNPGGDEPKKRRRGDDLEHALLDAAWAEFTERGFDSFTIDGVAQRASTSRAVLYRRWPGKTELVAAATRHATRQQRGPAPKPTGSLRGDYIALLTWANRTDVRTLVDATMHVGAYLAAEGLDYRLVRDLFRGPKEERTFSPLEQAAARGEVDLDKLTPRMWTIAADMFRYEVVLNQRPLTRTSIEEIVDQVVLPVLAQARVEE